MIEKDLAIKALTKTYGNKCVVDDFSMTIKKGDFVTILGPSGAGKTTVLKMVSGFEDISSGNIFLDGNDIAEIPAHKRGFGMLFQNYALFPHMTVEENIAYPLKIRKMDKAAIKEKVNEMLKMVELEGMNKRYPKQLSGGQQQRVALARAICFNPLVLLLDEPMAALDKQLRKQMQVEIKNIHNKLGLTTISVTHDQEEALTMATKVCVMRDGKIEQVDSPKNIYDKPNSTFIANFIGESTVLPATLTNVVRQKNVVAKLHSDNRELALSVGENEYWAEKNMNVFLIIRPEKVKIVPEDYTGEKFTGTITQSIYAGDTFKVEAVTPSGLTFKIKVFSRGKYNLCVGSTLTFGFRTEDLVLVRN